MFLRIFLFLFGLFLLSNLQSQSTPQILTIDSTYFRYINGIRDSIKNNQPDNKNLIDHLDSLTQVHENDSEMLGIISVMKGYQQYRLDKTASHHFFLKGAQLLETVEKPNWDQHLRFYFNAIFVTQEISKKERVMKYMLRVDKHHYFTLLALSEMIQFHTDKTNDYYRALDYVKIVQNEMQPEFVQNKHSYLRYFTNKMHLYNKLEYFDKVDQLVEEHNELMKLGHSPTQNIYRGFGNLYKNSSRHNQAIKYYKLAIQTAKQNGNGYTDDVNNMASSYIIQENAKATIDYASLTLQLAKSKQQIARAQNNLADGYLLNNEYDRSIEWFKKSLTSYCGASIIGDSIIFSNEKPNQRWPELYEYYADIGRAYYYKSKASHSNEYDVALYYYGLADREIDKKRNEHSISESKLFWRTKVKPIYNIAIDIAYQLENKEALHFYIEKSKAILLLDDFIQNSALDTKLASTISSIDYQIQLSQNKLGLDSTSQMLRNELERLNEVRDSLRIANKVKEINHFVLTQQQVINKLPPSTLVVNYVVTSEKIVGHAIYSNEKKVSWEFSLEATKQMLLPLLSDLRGKNKNVLTLSSYKQLKKLVLPITDLPDHLVILPDGPLYYLPFEALVAENNRFLLEDHCISYGFSSSTYFVQKKNIQTDQLLAFAPIEYTQDLALSPLQQTKHELAPLKRFKTKFYLNEEATKKNLISNWNEKDIIHISSHGRSGSVDNNQPWVATFDDYLFLSEIYNQKINANLVVLSACETNLGQEIEGEGIMSLGRGFFHIGANSIIASLWSVNEKSTAKIIRLFYKHLNEGKSKAESLRQAKIDFRITHPEFAHNPHYWAGIIYLGEDGSVALSPKKNNPLYVLILLLPLVFCFILIRKRIIRRSNIS